jgi:hypothetical protein
VFFRDVDWEALERKEIEPPFVPQVQSPEDLGNISEEFTNEAPTETLQEESMLLKQFKDHEGFDNFSFVEGKMADNIRATQMLNEQDRLGGGMGNSFMEFDTDEVDKGPRFGITEIEPKKNTQKFGAKKQAQPGFGTSEEWNDQGLASKKTAATASKDIYID